MSTSRLSLLALAPLFCCAPEPAEPDSDERAAALWEDIADRRDWHVVPHGHDVRIYAEDLAAVDGRDLSSSVPAGTLVACEQFDAGELVAIEGFQRTGDDLFGWYAVRYTADGVPIRQHEPEPVDRARIIFQCGDCHAG